MNNKISISNFEKAKKLEIEIKLIDKEIIVMEKMAMILVNNESEIQLTLQIDNPDKKIEKKEPNFYENSIFNMLPLFMKHIENDIQQNSKQSKTFTFTSTESLHILQSILNIRFERRLKLIARINKLGIEI